VLSFALKLLELTGFAPQVEACVVCGQTVADGEDAWFSPLQGGIICNDCHNATGEEKFSSGTRKLMAHLKNLDFQNPVPFTVKGGELMELETILYKFIMFQTDKPLNSISFLSQMGM
jgi:DNA repair protein RecO (recombination protein O)